MSASVAAPRDMTALDLEPTASGVTTFGTTASARIHPRAWMHRIPMRTLIVFDSAATIQPIIHSNVDGAYLIGTASAGATTAIMVMSLRSVACILVV